MASTNNLKEGDFYQKSSEKDVFYIVIDSKLRRIANLNTLENMIGSREPPNVKTEKSEFFDKQPSGPSITTEHPLIRGQREQVYLVDDNRKRYIISGEAFDRYHFLWAKIQDLGSKADDIQDGPQLTGRPQSVGLLSRNEGTWYKLHENQTQHYVVIDGRVRPIDGNCLRYLVGDNPRAQINTIRQEELDQMPIGSTIRTTAIVQHP